MCRRERSLPLSATSACGCALAGDGLSVRASCDIKKAVVRLLQTINTTLSAILEASDIPGSSAPAHVATLDGFTRGACNAPPKGKSAAFTARSQIGRQRRIWRDNSKEPKPA
jgi:hypothetical protein